MIAALEQDPFGYGVWTRLSGHYRNSRTEAAIAAFSDVRNKTEAEDRVRALLGKRIAQLQQIRRHLRLKARLYIHVPATIALLGALTAHIVSVFYYW